MTTPTASNPSPQRIGQARVDYAREVRFGIVMYGGVSLAIYINGVANELYELACATPKVAGLPPEPGSTREVYHRLSCLLRNPGLRQRYRDHLAAKRSAESFTDAAFDADADIERVRFVIDVIAGTSAGGINGVFLAKALANGQAFSALKTMWVQEGDIDLLLNDDKSYTEEISYAKTGKPPQSLLNSDRMYLKLLKAMEDMASAVPPIGDSESALSDEIDLYVTTTDILGAVVPLRLFDKVVNEKRHKQVFHFQYAAANGTQLRNDFSADNTSFLAFSARCTSSFPFAFEPMQVNDALRLIKVRAGTPTPDLNTWQAYFTGLSAKDINTEGWKHRAFGDGGYLDNKPFSYVVQALSWRLATVPMERKLIYIEPAPAHPELERQVTERKPNAIENALDALTRIPQYETIREDLQAVLERNRRIERVERIVRKVESDAEMATEEPFARVLQAQGTVRDWSRLDLGDMINYYGVAFLPYWRLRMTTVTDDVADRLADHWRVDRQSDRLYAMRALVRAWREERYYEHAEAKTASQTQSINAFVNEFDIAYRVRRASFMLRKTHYLLRVVAQMALPDTQRDKPTSTETALKSRLLRRAPALETMQLGAAIVALKELRVGLSQALSELRAKAWPDQAALGAPVSDADSRLLGRLLGMLIGEKLDEPLVWLPDTAGQAVMIALDKLPLPSPLRTLQENVFERTEGLFKAARLGRRTKLQSDLEVDIQRLADDFAEFINQPSHSGKLRVRDLLGDPQLKIKPAPTPDMPERQAVVAEVGDVAIAVMSTASADALNTAEARVIRSFLAEYYLRFDEYDQMSFPLYYDTGTGEPSTVEVVRVSPEDAPSLIDESSGPRRKLAGTALFNFGGFLDAQWRHNDIMWGRLDGCERLLATLLPDDEVLRSALLGQAQRAILREEMKPASYDELVQRFAEALAAQNQPSLKDAFDQLWPQLGTDDMQRRTRLALALQALFGDEGLAGYVKEHYEVRRSFDTEKSLKTASRAITITGRILEQLEKEQRGSASRMVWITRAGRGFQAVLAVSTPGSLAEKFRNHWAATLYVFEALVFIGAVVFGSVDARNFALTAFGVTLALHIASLITGDWLGRPPKRAADTDPGALTGLASEAAAKRPRYVWLLRTGIAFLVATLVLASVGVAGLLINGPQAMLCGKDTATSPRTGLRSLVCPSG